MRTLTFSWMSRSEVSLFADVRVGAEQRIDSHSLHPQTSSGNACEMRETRYQTTRTSTLTTKKRSLPQASTRFHVPTFALAQAAHRASGITGSMAYPAPATGMAKGSTSGAQAWQRLAQRPQRVRALRSGNGGRKRGSKWGPIKSEESGNLYAGFAQDSTNVSEVSSFWFILDVIIRSVPYPRQSWSQILLVPLGPSARATASNESSELADGMSWLPNAEQVPAGRLERSVHFFTHPLTSP